MCAALNLPEVKRPTVEKSTVLADCDSVSECATIYQIPVKSNAAVIDRMLLTSRRSNDVMMMQIDTSIRSSFIHIACQRTGTRTEYNSLTLKK